MSSPQPTPIPMVDLGAQYAPLRAEVEAAVCRVMASGQVINGPDVAALEKEVAAYCQVKHGIGCASGTDALVLALAALDIGPGDEVIMPPFTFFATLGSVCRLGATPIFADIDPVTYNIDPDQVAAKISPRTKAIIPVHLYGQCADMGALLDISERHNVPLIEDAAQAIGAEYQGRRAGSIGTLGCLSFYPSKNLGTYGDAGLVTTNDDKLAQKLKALRNHGSEVKYYHTYIGWNARIDTVQAAILRIKLPHLDRWSEQRQTVAKRYDSLIESRGLDHFIQRPTALPGMRHVFNQYIIRIPAESRDSLINHFKQNAVGCDIYYPLPLHMQKCIAHLGYGPGDFPISEAAAKSVLALPMFPELTLAQQERVVDTCASFFLKQSKIAA